MNVKIIAAHKLDFTTKEGEKVSGVKLYYLRKATDRETQRGWLSGTVCEDKFISASSGIKVPENLPLPCDAEFLYECVGRYNELVDVDFLVDSNG